MCIQYEKNFYAETRIGDIVGRISEVGARRIIEAEVRVVGFAATRVEVNSGRILSAKAGVGGFFKCMS